MRVLAYCAASFRGATERAAGVAALTCPPLSATNFPLERLSDCDLFYVDLHGGPGEAAWRGDGGIVALTAEQVRRVDLSGCVVFAANCYLGDANSPMLDALLDAGARYVIGGAGENWAARSQVRYGAHLLGYWVRVALDLGREPLWALAAAKRVVRMASVARTSVGQRAQAAADVDTLGFRAYWRPSTGSGSGGAV